MKNQDKPITAQEADIISRFTYHSPIVELDKIQLQRYANIRNRSLQVAKYFLDQCPPSRELSLAITHLEEAVMWANAAIARNERLENAK